MRTHLKFFLAFCLAFVSLQMMAQPVFYKWHDDGSVDLYNNVTNQFITNGHFLKIDVLNEYNGNAIYWRCTDKDTRKTAVYNSSGACLVKPIFSQILGWCLNQYFIFQDDNGRYGIVYNNRVLVPASYSIWSMSSSSIDLSNPGLPIKRYSLSELEEINKKIDEQKRAEQEAIRKAQEKKNEIALAIERLSSYEQYLNQKMEEGLQEWKKRGEFEKTADYEARVSKENEELKIEELKVKATSAFVAEAKKYMYNTLEFNLKEYDPDTEKFTVSVKYSPSGIEEERKLYVPIAEAPNFKDKAQYSSLVTISGVQYDIVDDKPCVSQIVFQLREKRNKYKYYVSVL